MLQCLKSCTQQCSGFLQEGGYGQGLSHIAAVLLMWFSEEDAFWALVQLMENRKYSLYGRCMGMVCALHASPLVVTKPGDGVLVPHWLLGVGDVSP